MGKCVQTMTKITHQKMKEKPQKLGSLNKAKGDTHYGRDSDQAWRTRKM